MIKVLKPGFYTTVQDLGRCGYLSCGVPLSGVMDRYASAVANALLGNSNVAPVLEMTMTGPILQFNCSTMICVSGAHMGPMLNDIPIKNNKAIVVAKGDVLHFGKLIRGFRAYLAVLGGFQIKYVMGSYSMYKNITDQIHVAKGDELQIEQNQTLNIEKYAKLRVNNAYLNKSSIEVFKGPECNLLSKSQQDALFSKTYTVSKNNNRMAYQLEEPLANTLDAIITSPVRPGTVQLTPSGQLIVLMRDCQTTGGYPRVLQLKASAIDVLSQKFSGNSIKFKCIGI